MCKRKITVQRTKSVCAADVFLCHIFLNKITASIFQIFETKPATLTSTEVLNEGVKSKLVLKIFLLFDIHAKLRRSLGYEVARGPN